MALTVSTGKSSPQCTIDKQRRAYNSQKSLEPKTYQLVNECDAAAVMKTKNAVPAAKPSKPIIIFFNVLAENSKKDKSLELWREQKRVWSQHCTESWRPELWTFSTEILTASCTLVKWLWHVRVTECFQNEPTFWTANLQRWMLAAAKTHT